MSVQVIFLTLNVANKQRIICDLIEKLYLHDHRVVITVNSIEEARSLDRMLWTWKQSSFIPHAFVECLQEKPPENIVITTEVKHNPGFEILILANPVNRTLFTQFDQVIDFAEKYNQQALAESRNRFREYQKSGFSIKTFQIGEFLHQLS